MPKVFLSAGNGGTDPGAVANGLKEKDINLQTLLACKSELERHGVTVVCSRTKDENDRLAEEIKEANASKADVAVSFHANAGGGDGFEVYYYSTNANDKKLAQLCEKYVNALGQNSRKPALKSGNHLGWCKNTKMTSCLVESFFLDNAKDKTIGDTVAEQKSFGVAYAKAILEYLGIKYKAPKTTNTTVKKADTSFKVKITATRLRIRKGAGTDTAVVDFIAPGVYTITETKIGKGSSKGWGKLKSGVGWISLDYATRV